MNLFVTTSDSTISYLQKNANLWYNAYWNEPTFTWILSLKTSSNKLYMSAKLHGYLPLSGWTVILYYFLFLLMNLFSRTSIQC